MKWYSKDNKTGNACQQLKKSDNWFRLVVFLGDTDTRDIDISVLVPSRYTQLVKWQSLCVKYKLGADPNVVRNDYVDEELTS